MRDKLIISDETKTKKLREGDLTSILKKKTLERI